MRKKIACLTCVDYSRPESQVDYFPTNSSTPFHKSMPPQPPRNIQTQRRDRQNGHNAHVHGPTRPQVRQQHLRVTQLTATARLGQDPLPDRRVLFATRKAARR